MINMKEILGLALICFMLFNYIWAFTIIIKCIMRRDWNNLVIATLVLIIMVVFMLK